MQKSLASSTMMHVSQIVWRLSTRTALTDEVAAAVVREGHVERLVDVTDPVPQILERRELSLVVGGGAQHLAVNRYSREEALRNAVATSRGDAL